MGTSQVYKGEQHGFYQVENIEDAPGSKLAFDGKVFGIEDILGSVKLKINNM